jgi:predicted O-methyltransferase YrrM
MPGEQRPLGDGLTTIVEEEIPKLPQSVHDVGSMLSYDERAVLHWAARTAPPGAIVDAGAFLGGSALALATGAEGREQVVHSYDLFRLDDGQQAWLPEGFDLQPGDSTIDVVRHNLAPVADRVVLHEGDIEKETWGDPISVLFVDVAKSWSTGDAVWRTFLPHVQPGGLIIQQDLVHWGHPWYAIIMEHLADHVDYLGWAWYSSAVYRCRESVRELPVPLLENFTCDQMVALVDRAARRFGEPASASVRMSAAVVLGTFGRVDEASARIAEIEARYSDDDLPYISEGYAYLKHWLELVRTQAISPLEHYSVLPD